MVGGTGLTPELAATGLFWYEAGGIVATFTSGFVSDLLHGNRNLTSLLYTGLLVPVIAHTMRAWSSSDS